MTSIRLQRLHWRDTAQGQLRATMLTACRGRQRACASHPPVHWLPLQVQHSLRFRAPEELSLEYARVHSLRLTEFNAQRTAHSVALGRCASAARWRKRATLIGGSSDGVDDAVLAERSCHCCSVCVYTPKTSFTDCEQRHRHEPLPVWPRAKLRHPARPHTGSHPRL